MPRLDSASFARKQLVRNFSHFGKRADDIPVARKSQWLSGHGYPVMAIRSCLKPGIRPSSEEHI